MLNKTLVLITKRNRIKFLSDIIARNISTTSKCFCSNSTNDGGDRNKSHLFINPQVQELLTRITRIDLTKVFRPVQRKLSAPEYQFHTDEELQSLLEEAKAKASEKLQMPPVLIERKPIDEILSKDPEIQKYSNSKHIAIDVTPGLINTDRHIVVREPNGILRKASWQERDNLLKIYFPVEGREVITPKMFQDEYLEDVLGRGWYEYILDRSCVQFEPDDAEYIKVTQRVYSFINEKKDFNSLRSTRHFGPMAFCLAMQKNIDNLLMEMIENEYLEDASDLVKLHHTLHTETSSAQAASEQKDHFDLIMDFVQKDSKKKSYLELAMQTLKELTEQRKLVEDGIQKAHGN